MRLKWPKQLSEAIFIALLSASPVFAQNVRVELAKHTTPIPKACESVVPAPIDGTVDIPALVQEANCKGAGDMLTDYTYVVNSSMREKGKAKEKTTTYEVFTATLKGGTQTKGVLVVTSRNGIPVPPHELEKKRLEAAELLEKEEERIALENPSPTEDDSNATTGMLPVGVYHRTRFTRGNFGLDQTGAVLAVQTFLRACDLTLARREQHNGRLTLIFNFTLDATSTYSQYIRFSTEVEGVKMGPPAIR